MSARYPGPRWRFRSARTTGTVATSMAGAVPIAAINITGEQVVLALRGALDAALSWELDICLEVAMEGRRRVVLDLEGLRSIDETTLDVIAEARERFRRAGGELVARSPGAGVRGLLERAALAGLVTREGADVAIPMSEIRTHRGESTPDRRRSGARHR